MNNSVGEADAATGNWSKPLPVETVRRLSTLNSWRNFGHILLEWAMIFASGIACWQVLKWNIYVGIPAYLLTILFIGSRQHALSVMMHEGAHYRWLKNRTANDFFTELFTAWPMYIAMRNYREHHFPHHRAPNTADDPDWEVRSEDNSWKFPKTRLAVVGVFFLDFIGWRFVDHWRYYGRYALPGKRKLDWIDGGQGVFLLTLIFTLTYFNLWIPYLLLWVVPMRTWLNVVLRMRTIAEHYALDYGHMYRQTRTTYPTWLERIFIAPKNIGYHLDHHLYPSVPFYHLPALHSELLKTAEFRCEAHITEGYVQVLRECLASAKGNGPGVATP